MGRVLKPVSKISGVYGQPGEEKVSQVLSECLSDEYVILNSPRLYYHGATFDIDHVVIGPNGIFVIETKNMQGIITGGLMGNWSQHRKRSGRNKVARIGNPANQVNQYGKVVRSQLKSRYVYETEQSIKFMVYPTVVFVHDDIDLSNIEYTKPGYVGRSKILKLDELCEYILRRESVAYEQEDVNLLAELLVPADQRDQTSYFSLDTLNNYNENRESRYEIYEEVGRGNYGVVFRGFDYKLDKEIAIKKLQLKNNPDSNAVGLFYREAQIASSLNHENIIAVYDYYENNGDYFIIMELVEGETLDKYVDTHKLTVKEALRIFRQICSAVAFAHQKHVVHRDLKPTNILMDVDGTVKVTDFGVAKLMNQSDLTLDRGSFGTPTVMAPEQISGHEVTERTDIFALGGLLYFLLTGKRPFEGEHVGEIIHKISYLDPPEMSRFNKEISADLESVVYKALEKRPEDRFQDVPQMIKSIDELLATGKLVTPIGRKRLYIKYIPAFLRPYIKTESSLISIITLASMIIFISILGIQSYKDYRDLVNKNTGEPRSQYGFNNENAGEIFDSPDKYRGLPVDLVGRIEKVTNLGQNSTEFYLTFQSKENSKARSVHVVFNQPHFSLPLVANIEVSGSIQGSTKDNGVVTPVIIADKIAAVEDPWTLLAPSLFNVYPNMMVRQGGKAVFLEKVEFSQYETRLYVRIKNEGKTNDTIYLNKPVGKQGGKNIKEIKTDYGISLPQIFQLAPEQEAGTIIFLEPIDYKEGFVTFTLGSGNDILSGQEPYKFEVKW